MPIASQPSADAQSTLARSRFMDIEPSRESYWRAVILFGRNVASYKFALGKTLLEIAQRSSETVALEELAEPFARHLCEHLVQSPRQATSSQSRFLDSCRSFTTGELTHDELIAATTRLGFVNVIDAFHVVGPTEIPVRFFVDERRTSTRGIRLTDELRALAGQVSARDLTEEVEARWRLVETAWSLGIGRALVATSDDGRNLIAMTSGDRRPVITTARAALNGYQKNRCFYCQRVISIQPGARRSPMWTTCSLVGSRPPGRCPAWTASGTSCSPARPAIEGQPASSISYPTSNTSSSCTPGMSTSSQATIRFVRLSSNRPGAPRRPERSISNQHSRRHAASASP